MMKKFYQALYRYGLKISAGDESLTKDCIQELFIKLWNNRAQLSDVTLIKPYLLTAFRRRIVDALSAHQTSHVPLDSAAEEDLFFPQVMTYSYEEFLIRQHEDEVTTHRLAQAMNKLTKRQREAVYLRYYENMEYPQIAGVMALKERSVYNLVHEGLNRLREEFGTIIPIVGTLCAALLTALFLFSA